MSNLYNRNAIGELPLIPNNEFKELCEKVAAGLPLQEIKKYKEQYSFEQGQQSMINALYQMAKTELFKVIEHDPTTYETFTFKKK